MEEKKQEHTGEREDVSAAESRGDEAREEEHVRSEEEQMMLDMLDEMIAQAEAGNMSMLASMPGMEGLEGLADLEGLMALLGGGMGDFSADDMDEDKLFGFSAQKSQEEAAAWAAAMDELSGSAGEINEEELSAELDKLAGIIDGDGRQSGFKGAAEEDYLGASELAGLRGMVSDRITKDGWCVGIMFRDPPIEGFNDSGWRFLQGDEDEVYMSDYNNHHIFEMNDVCNYDPDIVRYLNMPEGTFLIRVSDTEFARETDLGKLVLKRKDEEKT